MKMVQRWILEEILYKIPISDNAYGFRKGLSSPLKLNAENHKNNLFIFKMDLKDFFPSIDRDRVYYIFNQMGYNPTVANMFANICTLNEVLPQGAVTSPCLANLVCKQLDKRIFKYCGKREIVYTRYADDLTFSANDKVLLKSIFGMIKKIVEDEGFKINDRKTHFLTPKGKRTITGVTISNHDIKAPKEMKQKVRAMIHHAIVSGDYSSSQQIKGYIAYICSIEDDYLQRIKAYIQGFSKKGICLFKDSVDAYNANKFFGDLDDFTLLDAKTKVDPSDVEEYEAEQYSERMDYLHKENSSELNENESLPF
jgi:retron-type reverse transcriptase